MKNLNEMSNEELTHELFLSMSGVSDYDKSDIDAEIARRRRAIRRAEDDKNAENR